MLTPVHNKVRVLNQRTRRMECIAADSVDGTWHYYRADDEYTLWYLIHIPTGWTILEGSGSLARARRDTGNGQSLLDLWDDIHRVLANPRYAAAHDHARTVLAWMSTHEPGSAAIARHHAEYLRLRERAHRLRLLLDDLRDRAEDTAVAHLCTPAGHDLDEKIASLAAYQMVRVYERYEQTTRARAEAHHGLHRELRRCDIDLRSTAGCT